jgi:undecaprenyl-diphosphatase
VNEPSVWQAAVLGLLQGLSEFLPISSSAHLSLTPWLLNWPQPGLAFDVSLHIGTLVAVAWYFRGEWVALARGAGRMLAGRRGPQDVQERTVVFIIVGTIPGGIAGLLLNDYAEHAFRAPALTATALIVMGVVLWLVDRSAPAVRHLKEFTTRDAAIVGLAQVAALVPGVSRSGATIAAGRALGADRPNAALFSFLLSLPITAAAAAFKVPEAIRGVSSLTPMIVGVVCAAVSGWVAIAFLLRLVRTHGYGSFAIYRVVVGVAVLIVVFSRG